MLAALTRRPAYPPSNAGGGRTTPPNAGGGAVTPLENVPTRSRWRRSAEAVRPANPQSCQACWLPVVKPTRYRKSTQTNAGAEHACKHASRPASRRLANGKQARARSGPPSSNTRTHPGRRGCSEVAVVVAKPQCAWEMSVEEAAGGGDVDVRAPKPSETKEK